VGRGTKPTILFNLVMVNETEKYMECPCCGYLTVEGHGDMSMMALLDIKVIFHLI